MILNRGPGSSYRKRDRSPLGAQASADAPRLKHQCRRTSSLQCAARRRPRGTRCRPQPRGMGVAPSAHQRRFLQNLDSIADLFAELEQDRLTAREVAARVKQLA